MRDNAVHYKRGAAIRTANGKTVGTVDRIVFDPVSQKVTHIVVRQGAVFSTDRVISVDVLSPTKDGVEIEPSIDPTTFPEFEQSDYVLDDVSDFYVANPGLAIGAYGPIGAPNTDLRRHRERNLPEDSIALHANSDVIANDGEKVGRIKEIVVDSSNDRAVQLVVESGRADRTRRLLPASVVIDVAENEVHLGISSDDFNEYVAE